MKRFMIAAGAMALLVGGANVAAAVTAGTSNITIGATVDVTCTATGLPTGPQDLAAGGSYNVATITVNCNTASSAALSSQNGAVTVGGVSEGSLVAVPNFDQKYDYTAKVEATGGVSGGVVLDTSSTSTASGALATTAISGANNTSLTVTAATPGNPLVAGAYSDILTVSITAP
jgi:hypothetical protein